MPHVVPNDIATSIRRSKRARRIHLRMDPVRGLEIVLPRGVSETVVPEVLARHGEWIERTRVRMGVSAGGQAAVVLPDFVELHATGEIFRVLCIDKDGASVPYGSGAGYCTHGMETGSDMGSRPGVGAVVGANGCKRVTVKESPGLLRLPPCGDESGCEALVRWLRRAAHVRLGAMLAEEAQRWQFSYARLRIGLPRTRWGSCSAKGDINLNARLLFLPPMVARHVVLHELCHTCVRGHGPDFYTLLRSVDPAMDDACAALRCAWQVIPPWAR